MDERHSTGDIGLLPAVALGTLFVFYMVWAAMHGIAHGESETTLEYAVLIGGWSGGPAGTLFVDEAVVHGGRRSLRIERAANSSGTFSTATLAVPIDFSGKTIEMRGFLRTEDVTGFVGLWMREDGDNPSLAFDNMNAQQLKETTEWKEYSIRLPLHPDANRLYFGVLLTGTGKAWADDLQLLVDGKPIAEAPEKVKTVIDNDHEFDSGSKIFPTELTEAQRTNLTTLGKVWGFLKYYHPRVTKGELHWDYELFRIMPKVLGARDQTAADAVMQEWVAGLGPVAECTACARLDETDIHRRQSCRDRLLRCEGGARDGTEDRGRDRGSG